MLGDVSDAADQLVPGEQRQQPQQRIEPPVSDGAEPGEQREVGRHPAGDAELAQPRAACGPRHPAALPGLFPLLLPPALPALAGQVPAVLAPTTLPPAREWPR